MARCPPGMIRRHALEGAPSGITIAQLLYLQAVTGRGLAVSDLAWVRPKVRAGHAPHAWASQAVLVEWGGSLGYNAGLKLDKWDVGFPDGAVGACDLAVLLAN